MNECKVPGCDRHVHGHGYCNPHYQRWRKHGDPLADIPIREWGRTECTVPGCTDPHYSMERCVRHYLRWRARLALEAADAREAA